MGHEIVFIILTYYPEIEKIDGLIRSLDPHKVIIIDNTPDPRKTFGQQYKSREKKIPSKVTYLQNMENLGYTGGINRGLEYAYKNDATWSVILNDDLIISKKICVEFCNRLLSLQPCLAGPYPRYLDIKRWTSDIRRGETEQKFPDFLSGSFLAVHRAVIEKIGYLYNPYFIFYEEVEYCRRASNSGFPLIYIPLTGIVHKESSTFEKRQFLHQYYLARNHLLFIERNAPIHVIFYELIRFPKTIWEHYKKKEGGALVGVRDYLLRHFGPHKGSLLNNNET